MRQSLDEMLPPGQSPYFGMFKAGRNGYSIEECTSHCTRWGIPLRAKDIEAWQDGSFKCQMSNDLFEQELAKARLRPGSHLDPVNKVNPTTLASSHSCLVRQTNLEFQNLNNFPLLPKGCKGTGRRFFPCTEDNRPMMSWGWKPGYDPGLMTKTDAKVLSPVGWVGQNMLYQPFIVMDIDGVGHGCIDQQVINFGNQFRNRTLVMEDPNKVGSFHLYWRTDRLIPVKHFPNAKLDLMGNAVNAAVYLKNKQPNGIDMAMLTQDVWQVMLQYVASRKEN